MIILKINGKEYPLNILLREALNKNVNSEFKDYFVDNFVDVMEQLECGEEKCNPLVVGMLCCDNDIRRVVLENLGLVFEKLDNIGLFIQYLEKKCVQDNIDSFLKNAKGANELNTVFEMLRHYRIYDSQQMLEVLTKKLEIVYDVAGIYGIYLGLKNIPVFLDYPSDNNEIKMIDSFIANKVGDLSEKKTEDATYDFKYFNCMEEFKKKIQKIGVDFFINFPLDSSTSVEECKSISEELFGEFTTEVFSKMKFGQYDSQKALIFQLIIDELLEHSGENISDVKKIGEGAFSQVYKVGNYVIKVGYERLNEKIPNHRRILFPIIRTRISPKSKEKNCKEPFIEVQNLVDQNWYEGKSEKYIKDALFEIYQELRDDKILWTDIRPENVGKLLKENTSNFYYKDYYKDENGKIKRVENGALDLIDKELNPDPKVANIVGNIKGKPLNKGDYVILDSDCIESYTGKMPYIRNRGGILEEFENRYQMMLREKNGENIIL